MNTFFTNINPVFELSEVSVGQHFYWQVGNYQLHGQVLLTSWVVFAIIATVSFLGNSKLKLADNTSSLGPPEGAQNLTEFFTEYIRELAKAQIGEEEYLSWVPYLGTIFLFIFVSN